MLRDRAPPGPCRKRPGETLTDCAARIKEAEAFGISRPALGRAVAVLARGRHTAANAIATLRIAHSLVPLKLQTPVRATGPFDRSSSFRRGRVKPRDRAAFPCRWCDAS